jgi:hypothetical protein
MPSPTTTLSAGGVLLLSAFIGLGCQATVPPPKSVPTTTAPAATAEAGAPTSASAPRPDVNGEKLPKFALDLLNALDPDADDSSYDEPMEIAEYEPEPDDYAFDEPSEEPAWSEPESYEEESPEDGYFEEYPPDYLEPDYPLDSPIDTDPWPFPYAG